MSKSEISKKESFFAELENVRPDLMYPESWDKDKVDLANKTVRGTKAISKMFDAIPMKCRGDACPMRISCELYQAGIPPVGQQCPIERRMIRDFSSLLGESLNIDFDDFTELSQLRVIVDQEIQYIRKSHLLGDEGIIMENAVGTDRDGEAIMKKELSLAIEFEDRIHKRLKDYRNQLVATREARAKASNGEVDSSKAVAKILKEIEIVNMEKERRLALEIGGGYESAYVDAEVILDGEEV